MSINRDRSKRILSLDQRQSILDFLQTWKFDLKARRSTPMADRWEYGSDSPITDPEIKKEYQSKVGSMLFYAQTTRPDIAFAVSSLCRHMDTPNKNCMAAVRHLMAYLASHMDLGILYLATDDLSLESYCDATWGHTDPTTKARSTSGSVIYFGGGPVDWNSSLQSVVAQSSAESEHISAFNTARSTVYFRQFLEELGHAQFEPTVLWVDNTACIAQSKNPVNHKRNKHMLLKYHYLRDLVEDRQVRLSYISTVDQIADIFTKPLPVRLFTRLAPFIVRPPISSSSSSPKMASS
jgi:hypothetical protein